LFDCEDEVFGMALTTLQSSVLSPGLTIQLLTSLLQMSSYCISVNLFLSVYCCL